MKAGVSDTETESDSGTCSDLPLSIGPGPEFVQAGASDTETEEEEESINEQTFWYPNQESFETLIFHTGSAPNSRRFETIWTILYGTTDRIFYHKYFSINDRIN